jgi:hypothetical protein
VPGRSLFIGQEGASAIMAGVMSNKTAPEFESPDDRLEQRPEHGAIMNENRARQAVPLGRMRYVLAISLTLVIVGFIVLYALMRF